MYLFISFPRITEKKIRLKQDFPLFLFVRMLVSEKERNDFLFQLSIRSSDNPVLTNDIRGMLASYLVLLGKTTWKLKSSGETENNSRSSSL
jgi:hypothetical protein